MPSSLRVHGLADSPSYGHGVHGVFQSHLAGSSLAHLSSEKSPEGVASDRRWSVPWPILACDICLPPSAGSDEH